MADCSWLSAIGQYQVEFRIMPNHLQGKPRLNIGPTGRTVAFNVQRLRKTRGHTQTALAALLTKAGRRMSLSSLSEIELGTRRVDVDDLAALAAALQVSPNALLLPPVRGSGLACEVTGMGPVGTDDAWRWADGWGLDGWTAGRWFSNPHWIEDPVVKRAETRQQMLNSLIEAAERRKAALQSTPGVPPEVMAAIADELHRHHDTDPGDDDYWEVADYDPARNEDNGSVFEQLARIPGIESIVARTSASADDHS